MTISMILLWIAVVFEFLLILGLVKRSEDAKTDIKIIREALMTYVNEDSAALKNVKEVIEDMKQIIKRVKEEGKWD